MAPAAWNILYSTGMPPNPSAAAVGWQFAFPLEPNSVHYVTTPVSGGVPVGATAKANYTVTGDAQLDYHLEADNTCGGNAEVRIMLEQAGDTLAATQPYFRWWSHANAGPLVSGKYGLSVPIDPSLWSSVFGEVGNASAAAQAGFAGAIAHLGNVGLTFGGGCFYGHGVWALMGTGSFDLEAFTIQ